MARQRRTGQVILPSLARAADLTPRQTDVLQLAARGLSGKQIARQLGISRRTVEGHFSVIRHRTRARSTGELIAYAAASGLVTIACPGMPSESFYASAPSVAAQPGSLALLCDCSQQPGYPAGSLIGYVRVPTPGQDLDRHVLALKDGGCIRIFTDKQVRKTTNQPGLSDCLDSLHPGDTLVVPSLDRLVRSLHQLIVIVSDLRRRGAGFRSLHEKLDTTIPNGCLIFHVFAALPELMQ